MNGKKKLAQLWGVFEDGRLCVDGDFTRIFTTRRAASTCVADLKLLHSRKFTFAKVDLFVQKPKRMKS